MNPHLSHLLLLFFIFTATFTHSSSSSSSPISITLTPQILTKSNNTVRIQWSGIDSPSSLDWLGIYSPPNSSDSNFIGYVFLSTCPNWQSGSCSIHLPLFNLRSSYQFRVFRWTQNEVDWSKLDEDHNPLPGTKHKLGESEEIGFEEGRGPEQIHLAFTEREDEMRVVFVSGDGNERKYYVRYGDDEEGMSEVVETEVKRYEREDMCDAPANGSVGWRDPGWIHDGVVRNLKKGRRYYYKVMELNFVFSSLLMIANFDMHCRNTCFYAFCV